MGPITVLSNTINSSRAGRKSKDRLVGNLLTAGNQIFSRVLRNSKSGHFSMKNLSIQSLWAR